MRPTENRPALEVFPVTIGLLGLVAAVFLAEVLRGGSTDTLTLLRLGANYPPLVLEGQWYRLVTATLLHIGPIHLLMNGWALWVLGRLSEVTFGSRTTLALFVFTGVCGSALTLLSAKVSAGASGALFGIEGALVAFFLRHRERLTPAGRALLGQLGAWTAFMLAYTFLVPGIDWLGHLGGLLSGFAVGWLLRPWRGGPPGAFARAASVAAMLAIVGAIAALVASDRFVVHRHDALPLAVDAPASWRAEVDDGTLVVRDPLARLGTAAFVSVGREPAAVPETAVDRALRGGGEPAGLRLGPEPVRVDGWLRRTFVWQVEEGELAGFAQARCDEAGCVVALAGVAGALWADYRPTLERIAGSARLLPTSSHTAP